MVDVPEKVAEKLLAQEHTFGRQWLNQLMDAKPDDVIKNAYTLRIASPLVGHMQEAILGAETQLMAIPSIKLGRAIPAMGIIGIESGARAEAIVKALELDCVAGVMYNAPMDLIRPPKDEDSRQRGRE